MAKNTARTNEAAPKRSVVRELQKAKAAQKRSDIRILNLEAACECMLLLFGHEGWLTSDQMAVLRSCRAVLDQTPTDLTRLERIRAKAKHEEESE